MLTIACFDHRTYEIKSQACRAFGITRKTALDSKQYWVNRASTAARNEKEKGIALQYENEDSLTKRSEGLLTVLGVEPEALVEMARWVQL